MLVCPSCGQETPESFPRCANCGALLDAGAAGREERKTVTVLFCDVVGSTALGESTDPEALRALLARYFERMKAIVEHHGGSVEKFIGDAVMAVFGVPRAHEDDALRACRAAVEMREAFAGLGIEGRIGVATGEVFTGTAERFATGDAVNVAARLQQAAQPGEVLIAGGTEALLGDAVDLEQLEPLSLKGKSEPVAAFRLLEARAAGERRHDSSFVGREAERAVLADAWERAVAGQRCVLVTIVGEVGIGKSRLVAETLASVDARVIRGRCLPYGAGIGYWPVVEVLKQLDALPSDPAAARAVRSLLGASQAETSAEELAWAVRKLLEEHAPLVVVFDDIQWGEEAFLDLVEGLALLSSGAPLLLLCMARPELLDTRPSWPVAVRLEPLGERDSTSLIGTTISEDLRARITAAAAGNPLFISEMLAMTQEFDDRIVVPPTLTALLAARLDQLDPAERRVLERGAVEGEVFHRGAVQALAPEETQVTPRLAALVRRELIRPDNAHVAGEDGFRFRHLLIRDTAYDALPKATRAELHERFAAWLEQRGHDLVELDDLVGYHLEQTCRYRTELGIPVDDDLARAARRHLIAAGRRARLTGGESAAVNLFERALDVFPSAEIDVALEADLVRALFAVGRGSDALGRAEAVVAQAARGDDQVAELCGRILAGIMRSYLAPEGATDELATTVARALPAFEAAGDDAASYVGYWALGLVTETRGQTDAGLEAYERAATHAQRAGIESRLLDERASGRFFGSAPVTDLLAWLDEHESEADLAVFRAAALAMLGRFDEARATLADKHRRLRESGALMELAGTTAILGADIELWAGDHAAAAELGIEGCEQLEALGEKSVLSTAAGMLGQALYELGRLDEADAWAGRAAELGSRDDVITQMLWRQVRAKVLARRGEAGNAERLAREAVAAGEGTDMLYQRGDAYADLGEVLALAGRASEAATALERACEHYERKGTIVSARRARQRLAQLRFVPPDFEVPLDFETSDFVLEPLGPEHNVPDYAAWTSSMEHILATPGFSDGSWPHEMTLDENLADLERHADDFHERKGFTYTVLDPEDRDVIGCLYIYPLFDGAPGASVLSWVRGSHAHLDTPLWRAVSAWLETDWPFARVEYAPRD